MVALLLGFFSSWLARQLWFPSPIGESTGLAGFRLDDSRTVSGDTLILPIPSPKVLKISGRLRLVGAITLWLPGPHRVGITTNLGFNIYVDGKLVLTNLKNGPTGPHSGHMWLGPGRHILELELSAEKQVSAQLDLRWSKPGTGLLPLGAFDVYPAPSLLITKAGGGSATALTAPIPWAYGLSSFSLHGRSPEYG